MSPNARRRIHIAVDMILDVLEAESRPVEPPGQPDVPRKIRGKVGSAVAKFVGDALPGAKVK